MGLYVGVGHVIGCRMGEEGDRDRWAGILRMAMGWRWRRA